MATRERFGPFKVKEVGMGLGIRDREGETKVHEVIRVTYQDAKGSYKFLSFFLYKEGRIVDRFDFYVF